MVFDTLELIKLESDVLNQSLNLMILVLHSQSVSQLVGWLDFKGN